MRHVFLLLHANLYRLSPTVPEPGHPPPCFTSRVSLTQWKLLAPERRVGLQSSERVYHLLPLSWLPIVARSAGLHSAPTHVPSFTEPICTEAAALQGEMAPAHGLTLNTAKYMPRRQHALCKHSLWRLDGQTPGRRTIRNLAMPGRPLKLAGRPSVRL